MIVAWLLLAAAPIAVDPPPAIGQESVVTVIDDIGRPVVGTPVRIEHRPDLDGSRELAIGVTDGLGRARWKPEEGGVTAIKVGQQQLRVAVIWSQRPTGAIALTLIGALLALGTMIYGISAPRRWRP